MRSETTWDLLLLHANAPWATSLGHQVRPSPAGRASQSLKVWNHPTPGLIVGAGTGGFTRYCSLSWKHGIDGAATGPEAGSRAMVEVWSSVSLSYASSRVGAMAEA